MSNLNFKIKQDRVYEEWACACSDCFESNKVTYRQIEEFPPPHIAMQCRDRMELHGEEYHRMRLVRIFKSPSDIHTSFEVVPTLRESMVESDKKAEMELERSRAILCAYNSKKRGKHDIAD